MKQLMLSEEQLRQLDLCHVAVRASDAGETDVLSCGADLKVEVDLIESFAGEGVVAFSALRMMDAAGVMPVVVGDDDARLTADEIETIIWEKIEATDLVTGYMTGRERCAAAPGETILIDNLTPELDYP